MFVPVHFHWPLEERFGMSDCTRLCSNHSSFKMECYEQDFT
jgi:hypothetical protein